MTAFPSESISPSERVGALYDGVQLSFEQYVSYAQLVDSPFPIKKWVFDAMVRELDRRYPHTKDVWMIEIDERRVHCKRLVVTSHWKEPVQ